MPVFDQSLMLNLLAGPFIYICAVLNHFQCNDLMYNDITYCTERPSKKYALRWCTHGKWCGTYMTLFSSNWTFRDLLNASHIHPFTNIYLYYSLILPHSHNSCISRNLGFSFTSVCGLKETTKLPTSRLSHSWPNLGMHLANIASQH